MTALVVTSPELKKLWIRVLKRVHPDLAVDEQDRRRCERLTQQANDAYARHDEVALRAVLEPNGPPPLRYAPSDDWEAGGEDQSAARPQSTYRSPLTPQKPLPVSGREAFVILGAACGVLCLLLYGIFDALSERVGRGTSLSLLVLVTATVLWLITRNPKLSYNHKARVVAAVASGMLLVGICLLDSRPRANPLFPSARAATARGLTVAAALRERGNPPPSPWYWDVIKSRVEQSWNPSAVAGTPAGATADVAFTINHDGSPRDVELRRPSGSPSLDSSCVLAVQQVRTFGPPEGGTKDSLNVLYPCSYHDLASFNGHPAQGETPQTTASAMPATPGLVESLESQLTGYTDAARNKVAQNWNPSEVDGSTPVGATVYMQVAIRQGGKHEAPTMETSSGYGSLDVSCLRAVDRIQKFDRLPRSYDGDRLTVLYHCTYLASPTAKFAQDASQPAVQAPLPNGPVKSAHD